MQSADECRVVVRFRNRLEAASILAHKLGAYANRADVLVLALPRGGVPLGCEVARQLRVAIDVFLVRKLGVPWQPELAMGAIASPGVCVLDRDILRDLHISHELVRTIAEREQHELARREALYRKGRAVAEVTGKTVILVDDGIATGSSMRAAGSALRQAGAARIVVAVPVAASAASAQLSLVADEVICVSQPDPFFAISEWYDDFTQIDDEQVSALLEQAAAPKAGA